MHLLRLRVRSVTGPRSADAPASPLGGTSELPTSSLQKGNAAISPRPELRRLLLAVSSLSVTAKLCHSCLKMFL